MQATSAGQPGAVMFEGEMRDVACVQDRWRIDDEWWRETPVARTYFQCQLDGGRIVTLYRDEIGGGWWMQRY